MLNISNTVASHPNNKIFTRSPREELEKQKAYLERLNIRIVDATVRHLMREDSIQLAIDFLEEQDNTRASCVIIPLLHSVNDTTRMRTHIERVREDADAEETENPDCRICEENRALCEYFELLQEISFTTNGLSGITQQQLNRVSFLASQDIALAKNFNNLKDYLDDQDLVDVFWQPVNFGQMQKNSTGGNAESSDEIVERKEAPELLLYPNPTDNIVTIQYTISNPIGETNVSVYDLMGRNIQSEKMSQAQGSIEISTVDFPNGVYLVVLSDDNGRHKTSKLVVRH